MKIKFKYILSLGLIGFIISQVGSLQKITHQPAADFLLHTGTYLTIGSAVLMLVKIVSDRNQGNFWNK